MIQLRHRQPSLWHSGVARDIEDLWEPWMKEVDQLLGDAALVESVYHAQVPTAAERALAVPSIAPYLALWPVAPSGTSVDANGVTQTFNVALPTISNENYYTLRVDEKLSAKNSLAVSYFFDSGPQTQPDPLLNAIHEVFSRRQMASAEDTYVFSPALVNTVRVGVSRIRGDINSPVSGDKVATDTALAVAPGAIGPPQIGVPGVLTTAIGLGGLNRFLHRWTSVQAYDDRVTVLAARIGDYRQMPDLRVCSRP